MKLFIDDFPQNFNPHRTPLQKYQKLAKSLKKMPSLTFEF